MKKIIMNLIKIINKKNVILVMKKEKCYWKQ